MARPATCSLAPGPGNAAAADVIPAGVRVTTVSRQVVALAVAGGLRPRLGKPVTRQGRVTIILAGPGRDSIFGALYVGAQTGRILRPVLTHGNNGQERRYDSVAGIRAFLIAWLALRRSSAPADSRPGQPGTSEHGRSRCLAAGTLSASPAGAAGQAGDR